MTSDSSSFGGAALRTYQSYRYTITTMATGTKSRPIEAEMWYATLDASGKVGRWSRACTGSMTTTGAPSISTRR